MKDKSAVAFGHALQENHTIVDLDLSLNDFSSQAHVTLSKAIGEHTEIIDQTVVVIADRHIEDLKRAEKELFALRAQAKQQFAGVKLATAERDDLLVQLEALRIKSREDIEESERMANEVQLESEKVSAARRQQLMEFNEFKAMVDAKQGEATKTFHTLATKRAQVESRLKRAESRKLDAQVANSRITDDLRSKLEIVKDRLKMTLEEAHQAKASIMEREQAESVASDEPLEEDAPAPAAERKPKSKRKKGKRDRRKKAEKLEAQAPAEPPEPMKSPSSEAPADPL